jgi:hypothetical protein
VIDQIARDLALHRHGIPECLHVPIAAVDEAAISTYVGKIRQTLTGRGLDRALGQVRVATLSIE